MILQRNFSSASSGEVKKSLNQVINRYRGLDNKPGDSDPVKDRVTLSSDAGEVKVRLDGRSFSERVQAADGSVRISSFTVPGPLSLFSRPEGFEVVKGADGKIEGKTLTYSKFQYISNSHKHEWMSMAEAHSLFVAKDASFSEAPGLKA